MNVKELIEYLQTQPQDIQVAIEKFSDQLLLESKDICLFNACAPRPDGWIQSERPDMPTQTYLLFP